MKVRHWYHAWADGIWQQAASEHAGALRDHDFRADGITIGLVGSAGNVSAARDWFTSELAGMGPLDFVIAETGFEQVTLRDLYAHVTGCGQEEAILYAHTRGAMNPSEAQNASRRAATAAVLTGWPEHVSLLAYYDITGPEWRASPLDGRTMFFSCNFWWARASWLRTLPEPDESSRWHAEVWVGQGDPKVRSL